MGMASIESGVPMPTVVPHAAKAYKTKFESCKVSVSQIPLLPPRDSFVGCQVLTYQS